jgi:error-prone DNA polymerase
VASREHERAHGRDEVAHALATLRNELDALGFYVTDHPMRLLRAAAERARCATSAEVRAARAGQAARFAGLVAVKRRHPRAGGGYALLLTLEDEKGLLEAMISAKRYETLAPRLRTAGPYLVEGKTMRDGDYAYLRVRTLSAFRPFAHMWEVP